jgi:hypothetical protein
MIHFFNRKVCIMKFLTVTDMKWIPSYCDILNITKCVYVYKLIKPQLEAQKQSAVSDRSQRTNINRHFVKLRSHITPLLGITYYLGRVRC